jgi:hypothetical protein
LVGRNLVVIRELTYRMETDSFVSEKIERNFTRAGDILWPQL